MKTYEVPSIFYFFIHKIKVITTSVLVTSVGMRNENTDKMLWKRVDDSSNTNWPSGWSHSQGEEEMIYLKFFPNDDQKSLFFSKLKYMKTADWSKAEREWPIPFKLCTVIVSYFLLSFLSCIKTRLTVTQPLFYFLFVIIFYNFSIAIH